MYICVYIDLNHVWEGYVVDQLSSSTLSATLLAYRHVANTQFAHSKCWHRHTCWQEHRKEGRLSQLVTSACLPPYLEAQAKRIQTNVTLGQRWVQLDAQHLDYDCIYVCTTHWMTTTFWLSLEAGHCYCDACMLEQKHAHTLHPLTWNSSPYSSPLCCSYTIDSADDGAPASSAWHILNAWRWW